MASNAASSPARMRATRSCASALDATAERRCTSKAMGPLIYGELAWGARTGPTQRWSKTRALVGRPREREQRSSARREQYGRVARVRGEGRNDRTQGRHRRPGLASTPQREQGVILHAVAERFPPETRARTVAPRIDDEVVARREQPLVGVDVAWPLVQAPMQPATQLVARRHPGEQAGLQQQVVDQAIGVSALRQPGRIAPQFDVARLLARSIAVVPPLQETQLDHPNLQVTPEIRGLDGFDPLQSGGRCMHAARERAPGIDILYYRLIGDVDDRAIDPATLDQVALQVFQEVLERHLRYRH